MFPLRLPPGPRSVLLPRRPFVCPQGLPPDVFQGEIHLVHGLPAVLPDLVSLAASLLFDLARPLDGFDLHSGQPLLRLLYNPADNAGLDVTIGKESGHGRSRSYTAASCAEK